MRKALRVATAERPGAVHLSCAADTFKATATDSRVITPPMRPAVESPQIFGNDEPRRVLAAARRPLLLVGIGAVRCAATDAIIRLAETVGIPIVVTGMAKGIVPEDSEWFAGVLDMACNQSVWDFVRSSDLILAAGFDPVELIKPWDVESVVMHIGTVPNVDQVYASDVEVVGDVGTICGWLADEYGGQPRWTAAEVAAYRAGLRAAYYAGRVSGRLNPTDVVDTVRELAPADTIATCDVGSHKLLVGQGWTATRPRSVLMTNGLSAMGFGLPAAIAAKMTHPGRPVVAMIGDGGMAMTATELRLAAARGLGIVVVVFVDGSLNRIELKQIVQRYPSTATRIEDTDLVKLAEAMDCHGARVSGATELAAALKDMDTLTRPLVIEARIDPAQYESQF
jgi:acetolactate synthase-1/2/3 large subunit